MKTQAEIKQAYERFDDLIRKRPAAGRFTSTTSARLTSGLACEIEEGPWKFVCDMPESFGGEDAGPGPSFYGRAAIAACVTTGIAMRFARAGLPLDDVRVSVETDVDMADRDRRLTPFRAFRLHVDVRTPAPAAEAKRLVAAAVDGSTWRGNARTAFDVPVETTINGQREVTDTPAGPDGAPTHRGGK